MVIDGHSQEAIEEILVEDIEAMKERHKMGAGIFTQAGTYAPTLGVLGAVVGLMKILVILGTWNCSVNRLQQLLSLRYLVFLRVMSFGIHLRIN